MDTPTARASNLVPPVGLAAAALASVGLGWWGLSALLLAATVLAAVHHAEVVAERVGEPFGTLILALAVTIIETGLIVSLMLAEPEGSSALARDTVFAASMIILNLILGLCLIASARRLTPQQRFVRTGANAALSTIAALLVLTLVLPNFTTSVAGPVYSPAQLGFVAAFALILYLTFVFAQTIRHRDYFVRPEPELLGDHRPSARTTTISFALLLVSLLAVVLLAKSLSNPLGQAIAAAGAPRALVGIVIAAVVLLPEGLAALKAARIGRLQTSLNLALGSALATIGLTIPAVTIVGLVLDLPIALGLETKSMVLLVLTLFTASLSLARGRVTVLHGAVHLVIFAAYLLVTIVP